MENMYVNQTKAKSETEIELKIQSAIWKKPLILSIEKTDLMKVLVIKCAEELNCSPNTLKLRLVIVVHEIFKKYIRFFYFLQL